MNPETEHHSLLDDVLAEAAPPDFERAVRDGMLSAVRRRRQIRHWSRGLGAAGVFAAIALVVWHALLPTTPVKVVRPSLHIVSSQPLPASMVVATKPGNFSAVTSSPTTFVQVETGALRDPFKEIDDDQLLALAAGRPAALVRRGPNQAELFFVDPDDTNGLPVH